MVGVVAGAEGVVSAVFATATVDGVRLRFAYFAEWREGLPHQRNGARYPAVRVEWLATGERRQAGPLRARHFDADAVRYMGPGNVRVAVTSRPAWRVAMWMPLEHWPDGTMSWRLAFTRRGQGSHWWREWSAGDVHLTAGFVAWTRVALDHWLETGAALEWQPQDGGAEVSP